MRNLIHLLIIPIILFSCAGKGEEKPKKKEFLKMQIESPAFKNGENIPVKYTCDGEDVSPEIVWKEITEGVKSLALICDDPDAPMKTWVHWVIYNIPPESKKLIEGIKPVKTLANEAMQGKNDFRKIGYGGPCPPRGTLHHYHFKLYGLDIELDAEAGITKKELHKKMEGHVIATGEIIGIYKRK